MNQPQTAEALGEFVGLAYSNAIDAGAIIQRKRCLSVADATNDICDALGINKRDRTDIEIARGLRNLPAPPAWLATAIAGRLA